MPLWFGREESEVAMGLLLWRTVQMTVLECLDWSSCLTNQVWRDCLIVILNAVWTWRCVRTHPVWQTDGWMGEMLRQMDRSPGCGRRRSVSQSSLLLSLFPKRRKWQDRSSNASVSLSPEGRGARGLLEKGQAESTRGPTGLLWSRASHVMPQCRTEHSDPPWWKLSRRGQQRTPHLHTHLRGKDTHVAAGVAQRMDNQSKFFGSHWRHWHIRKDLLHTLNKLCRSFVWLFVKGFY